MRPEIKWSWMGRVPYREASILMDKAVDEVLGGDPGGVFMLEHPPMITLGRRAGLDALKAPAKSFAEMGIAIERTDRGGLATYHGPGQLVCYPVLSLKKLGLGVGDYVEALLGAAAKAVETWGVKGCRIDMKKPGVWTDKGKIAAVGLRVQGEAVSHGLAINLDVEKGGFEAIISCGEDGLKAANVSDFATPPDVEIAAGTLAKILGEAFGITMVEMKRSKTTSTGGLAAA